MNRTMPSILRLIAMLSVLVICPGMSHGQDATLIERNDTVGNVIIIDGKMVVRQQLPGEKSGLRLNVGTVDAQTYAKEQAIENRVTGNVVPQKPPSLVKGDMDNIIQAEGVYATKRSKDATACVEIGAVGGDEDCREKK